MLPSVVYCETVVNITDDTVVVNVFDEDEEGDDDGDNDRYHCDAEVVDKHNSKPTTTG